MWFLNLKINSISTPNSCDNHWLVEFSILWELVTQSRIHGFYVCFFRPENAKRLYDLVQVKDPDVKIAFYFALKDTLVADTLDQATRIAYPKVSKHW